MPPLPVGGTGKWMAAGRTIPKQAVFWVYLLNLVFREIINLFRLAKDPFDNFCFLCNSA